MNYVNYSECFVTLNNRRVFANSASLNVNNNVVGIRNIDSTAYRQVIKEPIKGSLNMTFYITDEFEDLNPMRLANCIVEENITRNHDFSSAPQVMKVNEYERSAIYPRGNYGSYFANNQMLAGWEIKTTGRHVVARVGLPEFMEGGAHYEGHGVNNASALELANSRPDDLGAALITQKGIFEVGMDYMVEVVAKVKDVTPGSPTPIITVAGSKQEGALVDQYQTYLFEVSSTNKDLRVQVAGPEFKGQTVYIGSVKAYLKREQNFHDGFSGSIGPITFRDAYLTKFGFSVKPFSPVLANASFDVYGHVSGQPGRESCGKASSNFHQSGILGVDDNPDIFDKSIPHGGRSTFYSISDVGITESLEFSYELSINRTPNHEIGDLFPRTVTRGTSDIRMTLKGEGLKDALSFKGSDANIAISLFNISGGRIQKPTEENLIMDFDATREGYKIRKLRLQRKSGSKKVKVNLQGIDQSSSMVKNEGVTFKDHSSLFLGNDYLEIIDNAGSVADFGAITGDMTMECLFKISEDRGDWVRLFGRGSGFASLGIPDDRTYGLWYNVAQQAFLFQQYTQDPIGGGSAVDPALWAGGINVMSNRTASNLITPVNDKHIRLNTWYHLTAIRNALQSTLFLNGKIIASIQNNGETPRVSYSSGATLGERNNLTIGYAGYHKAHEGEISMCRLYNKALSENDIKQNFTNFSCDGKIISQDISVSVDDVLQGSITIQEKL